MNKDSYFIVKKEGLDVYIEGNKHELKLTKHQQVLLLTEMLTKWRENKVQ